MTDIKISELTNLAAVPDDTDEFPFNDGSTTKAIAAGYIRRKEIREITSSGSQSGASGSDIHLALNHGSAINYSFTNAPTAGDQLTIFAVTGATHTVTLFSGVTYNGTNAIATFNTIGESLILVARSATRFDILYNNGVTFS